jgi:hypothetical protein
VPLVAVERFCRMTRDLNPAPDLDLLKLKNLEVQGYRDAWLNGSHSVILDVEVLSPKSRKDPFDAIDGNSGGCKQRGAF